MTAARPEQTSETFAAILKALCRIADSVETVERLAQKGSE